MKNLLLICKNSKISETLCRVLSGAEEVSHSVTDNEELYKTVNAHTSMMGALGSGLSDKEEESAGVDEKCPDTVDSSLWRW